MSYEGKTKVVEDLGDGTVVLTFKDDITAGDGAKHDVMAGKGAICAEMTALLMRYLKAMGVANHFLEYLPPNRIRAIKLSMVPVEVVVRFRRSGSFIRRYGGLEGEPFKRPLLEFFLKDDARHDPMLCGAHLLELGLMEEKEVEEAAELALDAARSLRDLFERAGLELWDIKFEVGRNAEGRILLGDELSPDSMRLRREGAILDKDVYRRDLGDPMPVYREVLGICRGLLS